MLRQAAILRGQAPVACVSGQMPDQVRVRADSGGEGERRVPG